MQSMDTNSVASSSCEMILGQGAAGTVKVYNSSRLGPTARKMMVMKSCYDREKYFLEMCLARKSEPLFKFIINCVSWMHKGDHLFVIDFELAATDLHRAAVNVNDVPTGCTQWFPDSDSFDRALADTLSGLMFLHEHVNIYHNDIKPANLLIVRPNGVPQIVKIGDMGLCTEMDKRGRSFGTFGYSSPEIYDSKRFNGDPVDASYAILGKSDVFSMGLSLIFVTEGERPYQIPRDFQIAFEEFCDAPAGQARNKMKYAMCAVASDFYYSQFSPKIPACKNINAVSFAARHVIASMCEPYMDKRPTARQCFDDFYKMTLIEHPSEPPKYVNVSTQAVANSRADVSSIRGDAARTRIRASNFDKAANIGLGDFSVTSAASNAVAPAPQQMDVNMQRNQAANYSDVTLTSQLSASQGACTVPKYPNGAAAAFKVPQIPIATLPLKRRAVTEVIDDADHASHGNKHAHYSATNSNASAVAHRWAANANVVHEPLTVYSPIGTMSHLQAPASVAQASNGGSNASLISGMQRVAFHEQPSNADDYDAIANELAGAAANLIDAETARMNELLQDAMGKDAENFRDYVVSINASAEKIALLDELRFRKPNAAISQCALKLLRLLHSPNHPLYGSRVRLFTTITGYKKNWWKKSPDVRHLKELNK